LPRGSYKEDFFFQTTEIEIKPLWVVLVKGVRLERGEMGNLKTMDS
jgi:hypothetical protein